MSSLRNPRPTLSATFNTPVLVLAPSVDRPGWMIPGVTFTLAMSLHGVFVGVLYADGASDL